MVEKLSNGHTPATMRAATVVEVRLRYLPY